MLAGLALQSRTPRRRLPSGLAPAGLPVIAGGVALNVWAVSARGAGDLEHPDRLVTSGPYAVTRNPMYVGWSLLHLGLAMAARSPWVLASWPVSFALVHRAVLREDRQLATRFGPDLTDYQRRVPRYGSLPRTRLCAPIFARTDLGKS